MSTQISGQVTRNHLDLFSGIGGFALAAKWAGFTTVGLSEIDPYASKVLDKNFPKTCYYLHRETHTDASTSYPHPAFLEEMMGYPIGHTELKPSETPSSHKSPTKS